VKDNQEKDKIETKPDKNEKRGRARRCQKPVTLEKAEKEKKIQLWRCQKPVTLEKAEKEKKIQL
nr:hypothetical protein [Tanacetum cinerariifolium]